MAGDSPPPAAEPESEAGASSLLALAESELAAGRLRAARKHARRAALLDPTCPRAALILTAASVLLADESSHRAVLLLPSSSSSPSALRRHFKSLAKSLRPRPEDGAASSPAVAAAAEDALGRAAAAYEALTAPAPDTFWTACAGCRLLHEFERRYLGYRLMCPSCRRTFLATEVPPPPEASAAPSASRPPTKKLKTETPEDMTLAEMQSLLAKKRGAKHRNSLSSSRREVEEHDTDEDAEEEEEQNNRSELMAVEDSDFYNFDADRSERCVKRGQVWALYGDDDGMPRHYAVVDNVLRGGQFRAQVRWLDGEEGKPCGQFKVGRLETLHSVNVFSHLVACERAALELYRVYPRKRSVWALREEGGGGRVKHEIVVFLSCYSDHCGASFGYLKKVQGFRSIFARRGVGSRAVHTLLKADLGALSHQIPARMVSKGEGSTLPPGDCWELDPASLPSELLRAGVAELT